jgi:hypothetical protein
MNDVIAPPDGVRTGETGMREPLPNSTGVLVLGILSIIFCWCLGFIGIILGIVGLILGSRSKKLYREDPDRYSLSSYKNLNAGYICSLVGTIVSGLYLLLLIISILFGLAIGTSLLPFIPWEDIFSNF